MRVAIIFRCFGPYHCARLEAAARHFETIGIEVAAETQEYAWAPNRSAAGFSRITLFQPGKTSVTPAKRVSEEVQAALQNCAANAVALPGWSDRAALAALRWCVKTETPVILMSESTALDYPRVPWREGIKRRIIALCSSALVGGQLQADYLMELGMPHDRIFRGYDVVDNKHFHQGAEAVRSQGADIRKRYGLPENYFLASARFIEKKNLPTLFRAFAQYRQRLGVRSRESAVNDRSAPWDLVLLGDGPLKPSLCRLIADLRLQDHVLLPGFKQYDELPTYYALAKAFVHASTTEQWGLVVNEALASGLPVIVSNRCGCVPELVQHNGFTFDPENEHELASRLLKMASLSDDERKSLGGASLGIAADFGPEHFADGLGKAAELALTAPPKKSILNRIMIGVVAFAVTSEDRKTRRG